MVLRMKGRGLDQAGVRGWRRGAGSGEGKELNSQVSGLETRRLVCQGHRRGHGLQRSVERNV